MSSIATRPAEAKGDPESSVPLNLVHHSVGLCLSAQLAKLRVLRALTSLYLKLLHGIAAFSDGD